MKLRKNKNGSSAVDMTEGSIPGHLVMFALPLLLGNLFQMFYNTVDILVVGNFVGKEALAAVGSTASIVNIVVFFFNGVSIGAGVVISHYYGAQDYQKLHRSVETTMALTFVSSVFFTILGVCMVPIMLRLMSTPDDVMASATIYLRIYFAGISGLLLYNMGSGILRAVGDTRRPLLFLILTSLLNVVLDLFFVIGLHTGVAGVAVATILSQFISAGLILTLLTRTKDIYHFSWKDLGIDQKILKQILNIGLPAGIQSTITSFSNVFVQGYINHFGSSCMAGWSCYNKLEQFVLLSIQSMGQSSTTFVSQNIGAGKEKRANQGIWYALMITLTVIFLAASALVALARPAAACFSQEKSVIEYTVLFLRLCIFFTLFNGVNHVLAGGLRGRGDARGPMIIMLLCFVAVRQSYLYIGTRISSSIYVVVMGYPVGWMSCCVSELGYFYFKYIRNKQVTDRESA